MSDGICVQKTPETNGPDIKQIFAEQGEPEHQAAGGDGMAVHFQAQPVKDQDAEQGEKAGIGKGRPYPSDEEVVGDQEIRLFNDGGHPG